MSRELLEDTFGPVTLVIEESADGTLMARGEFGFCGKPTANGRVYSRGLMEREFKRLNNTMEARGMYGELDHPENGKTSVKRISHVIRSLKIESNGKVSGSLEVLTHPDIPNGRLLKGLVESGVPLGVSSRGVGSVRKNRAGLLEVQEDFRLLTYDVVADPAWREAVPSYAMEGDGDVAESTKETGMTFDELKKLYPDMVDQVRNEERIAAEAGVAEKTRVLESQFAGGVEKIIADAEARGRTDALASLHENGAGDVINPITEVGRLAEQISMHDRAVEEKDLSIQALRRDLLDEQIRNHLRHHLSNVPEEERDVFVGLLGESSAYSTFEAFESRIDVVVEEFDRTDRYLEATADNFAAVLERMAEGEELLETARNEIVELRAGVTSRNELLGEASDEIKSLTRASHRKTSLLEEAQDEIERSRGEAVQLQESFDTAAPLTEERIQELEIELHRHKAVLGASNPTELLGQLVGASTCEAVDELMESIRGAKRPIPPTPKTPATSNGARDFIFEDKVRNSILGIVEEPDSSVLTSTAGNQVNRAMQGLPIFESAPDGGELFVEEGGDIAPPALGGGRISLPGLSPTEAVRQVRGD